MGQRVLVVTDDGDLLLGDLSAAATHQLKLISKNIKDADLSSRGDVLVSCSRGKGGASVWREKGAEWKREDFVENEPIAAVRLESEGQIAALGFADKTQLWSIDQPAPILKQVFSVGFVSSRMAKFLNSTTLFVAAGEYLFAFTKDGQSPVGHFNAPLRSVTAGTNGMVATTTDDRSVWVYDVRTTPKLVRHITSFKLVTVVSMNEAGGRLMASAPHMAPIVADFGVPEELRKQSHP
jgi:hypothetical protein